MITPRVRLIPVVNVCSQYTRRGAGFKQGVGFFCQVSFICMITPAVGLVPVADIISLYARCRMAGEKRISLFGKIILQILDLAFSDFPGKDIGRT